MKTKLFTLLLTLNKFLLCQHAITRLNLTVKRLDKKDHRKLPIGVANWGLSDTFIMNSRGDNLTRGYSPVGLGTIKDIERD